MGKIVARGTQKCEALGHGLFGLCVNPSLAIANIAMSWCNEFKWQRWSKSKEKDKVVHTAIIR